MSAHRSVSVAILGSWTFTDAIEKARVEFDALWGCDPETRPFNIVRVHAQEVNAGTAWSFVVEAEDA